VLSPETVEWCAERKYPYLGLGTSLRETVELWNLYGDTAAKNGYLAGSENFGYVQHVFVTDNEQKAEALGKCHLFGGGQVNFSRPEHTLPPGYNSKAATRRLAQATASRSGTAFLGVSAEQLGKAQQAPRKVSTKQRLQRGEASIEEARAAIYSRYPKTVKSMAVISGTPKTVLPKIRRILETLRPSVFGFFATQGPVSFQDRMTNIRLLGQEVLPAVREYGKELGLLDPFERDPGARPYIAGTQREPLVSIPKSRSAAAT
jgi:alkanesulfonate monooxygenase SsuD/methylene tetrahydromethanopterin reductase-like flavin-dependent oxidoreductase (luciferase family)